jgi:hypothetical protein
MNRLFGLQHRGVGSGDHFEMKICPSVNFVTTQQMKCKHFFVHKGDVPFVYRRKRYDVLLKEVYNTPQQNRTMI